MNLYFKIHPISFIKAMSMALELTNTGISNHHCRTTIIAKAIAKHLQLSQPELQTLIYASLLHDIGAASNWEEKHSIMHDDNTSAIFHHPEAGYQILKGSPFLLEIAVPIRHHHDRYCGGNPSGLKGEQIPLLSRIIHISDRIEVMIDKNKHIFKQRQDILSYVESSDFFDPALVKIVKTLSASEGFWLDIVNYEYQKVFLSEFDFFGKRMLTSDDLINIAEIFSGIVDGISPFTLRHSRDVAATAIFLARKHGFNEEELKLFYLAGLLHDLGKLAVPNEIVNKPDKLTEEDYAIIKQHPYYSQRILQQIEGFEEISNWVGQHHEALDGQGYPYGLCSDKISLGARILTVADIFCALTEDRPYRRMMNLEQTWAIMDDMAEKLKLDPNIYKYLKLYPDEVSALLESQKKL
ncbi:MAG: HD domain-containing phosphohydrolase [Bacillota bacterium]|nr:HD domain-containing phosphohydrolase [Bacillota bacterium]